MDDEDRCDPEEGRHVFVDVNGAEPIDHGIAIYVICRACGAHGSTSIDLDDVEWTS